MMNDIIIFGQNLKWPRGVSMFPSHIAWLCKYPEFDRFDLSSVLSISVVD
jgi:hypothetical protein